MNYNQIPDWYLNFRRSLDRFTRMATVVALVISGVWGAIAWAVGATEPMFRVLSVRTAPVYAALVSFPQPQYHNAVEVDPNKTIGKSIRIGDVSGLIHADTSGDVLDHPCTSCSLGEHAATVRDVPVWTVNSSGEMSHFKRSNCNRMCVRHRHHSWLSAR